MADTDVFNQWKGWADTNISGDPAQKVVAADAAAVTGLLGADVTQDLVRAAENVTTLTMREDYVSADDPEWTPEKALKRLLDLGWYPTGIEKSPFMLNADERLLAQFPCELWIHQAVARKKGHAVVGGASPVGLALLAASAIGNAAVSAKRAADAAAKWRPAGQTKLFVTNQRVVRQGNNQWFPNAYAQMRSLRLSDEGDGVVAVVGAKAVPLNFKVANPRLLFALMAHFVQPEALTAIDTTAAVTASPEHVYVKTKAGATLTLSKDRKYWWDEQTWQDTEAAPPPAADRSDDGVYWWDGVSWRMVNAGLPAS